MFSDFDLEEKIRLGVLWFLTGLHWVNGNIPLVIGWLTIAYTALRVGVAYREFRSKAPKSAE